MRRDIDVREALRFLIAGLVATAANLAATGAAGLFMRFSVAATFGIAVGIITSFLLSKFFAFRSRSWRLAYGESVRFLIVYSLGAALYWVSAVVSNDALKSYGMNAVLAGTVSILAAGFVMMVISYCGHRLFTYQSAIKENAKRESLG